MGTLNKMMFSGMIGYLIGVNQGNSSASNHSDFEERKEQTTQNHVSAKKQDQVENRSPSIHSSAIIKGNVMMEDDVDVGAFTMLNARERSYIRIGSGTTLRDGVIMDGAPHFIPHMAVGETARLSREEESNIEVGENCFFDHQAQLNGPITIGDDVYVGPQSFISHCRIGNHSIISPGAKVVGVEIEANRLVPIGAVITEQEEAENLPSVILHRDGTFSEQTIF